MVAGAGESRKRRAKESQGSRAQASLLDIPPDWRRAASQMRTHASPCAAGPGLDPLAERDQPKQQEMQTGTNRAWRQLGNNHGS